jgi:hypothetical protein
VTSYQWDGATLKSQQPVKMIITIHTLSFAMKRVEEALKITWAFETEITRMRLCTVQ